MLKIEKQKVLHLQLVTPPLRLALDHVLTLLNNLTCNNTYSIIKYYQGHAARPEAFIMYKDTPLAKFML